MGVNKVVYGGKTLVDLTPSTVTSDTLLEGTIAFDAAGNKIVGTLAAGSGADVDVSSLVPKVGDRGALAGYNDCAQFVSMGEDLVVTIDQDSPDDMMIMAYGNLTLNFADAAKKSFVKNIFVMSTGTTTANFGKEVYVDTYYNSFVNELSPFMISQIVVANYYAAIETPDGIEELPQCFISQKVLYSM